jgi:hypothetical protein
VEEVETLEWITTGQRERLDALSAERGDWQAWLPETLTELWSDWTQAAGDDLVAWLDETLPSLEAEGAAQQVGSVDDLSWVSAEQRERLEVLTAERGHWADWLAEALTGFWAGWTRSNPDQLVPWLDELLPSFEAPAAEASNDQASVEDLGWVTAEQREQLETLTAERGDWPTWLPSALNDVWPDWISSTPDQLTAWLDGLMPYFGVAGELAPDEIAAAESFASESSVVELDPTLETAANKLAEYLDRALAAELDRNPALREIPEDQLRSLLREQLALELA